jgi:glycosyltransferase involved in cell wall biosynthesis
MTASGPHNRSGRPRAVCVVIDDFYPPSRDSIQLIAYDLSREFGTLGWNSLVLTRQTEPPSACHEQIGTIDIRRLPPAGMFKGKGLRAVWPVLRQLCFVLATLIVQARRYEVILTIGSKLLPVPVALASVLTRKPWFVRAESPSEIYEQFTEVSLRRIPRPAAQVLVRFWRVIRLAALRRATGYIAISPEISDGFKRLNLDPHKIIAIPNSVDMRVYRPVSRAEKLALRRRLGLPETDLIFAYTGRLVNTKGLPYMLEAWADLANAYPDVHLVLVGSGHGSLDDCEAELRAFVVEQGLQSRVCMTGKVDNVAEYLQAADVFVFPSDLEGFSLALTEAMATGLPAVATRVGAADQLVEDHVTGFLVEPRDQEAIRAAMEQMITHRGLLPDMGIRARAKVADLCSLEKVATDYMTLFAEADSSLIPSAESSKHLGLTEVGD